MVIARTIQAIIDKLDANGTRRRDISWKNNTPHVYQPNDSNHRSALADYLSGVEVPQDARCTRCQRHGAPMQECVVSLDESGGYKYKGCSNCRWYHQAVGCSFYEVKPCTVLRLNGNDLGELAVACSATCNNECVENLDPADDPTSENPRDCALTRYRAKYGRRTHSRVANQHCAAAANLTAESVTATAAATTSASGAASSAISSTASVATSATGTLPSTPRSTATSTPASTPSNTVVMSTPVPAQVAAMPVAIAPRPVAVPSAPRPTASASGFTAVNAPATASAPVMVPVFRGVLPWLGGDMFPNPFLELSQASLRYQMIGGDIAYLRLAAAVAARYATHSTVNSTAGTSTDGTAGANAATTTTDSLPPRRGSLYPPYPEIPPPSHVHSVNACSYLVPRLPPPIPPAQPVTSLAVTSLPATAAAALSLASAAEEHDSDETEDEGMIDDDYDENIPTPAIATAAVEKRQELALTAEEEAVGRMNLDILTKAAEHVENHDANIQKLDMMDLSED